MTISRRRESRASFLAERVCPFVCVVFCAAIPHRSRLVSRKRTYDSNFRPHRSVRYGGKHQSVLCIPRQSLVPNACWIPLLFFTTPPCPAPRSPALPPWLVLSVPATAQETALPLFPSPLLRKPSPPVSRSSLAGVPIHHLELGGTTSPRCLYPKALPSGTRDQDCFYRRCPFRPSTPHPCHPGQSPGDGPPHQDVLGHQSAKGADKTSNASYLDMFFSTSLMSYSTLKFY